MIASLGQRGKNYNTPEGRAIVLDQLINQKLLLLDATRNLYEREPEFKAELARVKEDLLVNYAVNKAVANVRVTDAEAKEFFDAHPEQFAGEKTVNASHILVADEAQANEILAKINAGELSFEDAAKQYSSCPSSAEGGCLGDFGHGQMVPEFDQACFSMAEGEIAGPVQTQFGFHLIKLNKINEAQPMQFEQVKEQLRQSLLGEKQQNAYQSKINQLKILYPVDRF
ncbi:MAG: peptidylprolyl isomerase [Clostridia bacterium]|nr:peptidylprolyl isomerase [Clostridia bacterium]